MEQSTPTLPHVLSVNLARDAAFTWRGESRRTGIYKEPVARPVAVRRLGLEGDFQADLRVHGGPRKAVYAYPSEHYSYWRERYPHLEFPWGMFGENLSTVGLTEDTVHVGDRFQVGTAVLQVTQPREPCFKLGLKFQDGHIVKQFADSRRSGFYFSVVADGVIQAGDPIEVVSLDPRSISIFQVLDEAASELRRR